MAGRFLPPRASAAQADGGRASVTWVSVAWASVAWLLVAANPLHGAQDPARSGGGDGWNDPRTLELVDGGRLARATLTLDGGLESYEALTEGHVYFFIDPEVGERVLIRIDQVAVELRWAAPDRAQQRIVGERSETRLPVQDFRYYADRITLVQHGFGNEIRVGSGMDVSGVPHPLAPLPGNDPDRAPYDYRIADSLSITLPGRSEPLRLYELDVRPRNPNAPGIVGTITLDRATLSIVRMGFTFTPASYVDPRTDRITVELDYGLWEDRYWLPNLQRIEVRRELPEFDLGVGTVIRAVLRTGGYELNVPLPESFDVLPSVSAAPPAERERFTFREGLYDGLERDGLSRLRVEVDPRQLRAEGVELLASQSPSGLRTLRPYLPGFSEGLRYRRSEGLYLGMGAGYRTDGGVRLRGHAGYPVASARPQASLLIQARSGPGWLVEADARLRFPRDLGLAPGADPLLSSLAAVIRGEDYMDPYRTTGGEVRLTVGSDGGTRTIFALGGERVEHAGLYVADSPFGWGRPFRPVRPVAEGDFLRAGIAFLAPLHRPWGSRGESEVRVEALSGSPGTGVGVSAQATGRWGPLSGTREALIRTRGWSWFGDPLPQGHRLLGGRNTLPGFPYRSFVGRRAATAALELSADALGPRLRIRGGVHTGWAGGGATEVLEDWYATGTDGVRASATAGVGLFWDLLRIDLARGLGGGEWQLLLSIDPGWWDRL